MAKSFDKLINDLLNASTPILREQMQRQGHYIIFSRKEIQEIFNNHIKQLTLLANGEKGKKKKAILAHINRLKKDKQPRNLKKVYDKLIEYIDKELSVMRTAEVASRKRTAHYIEWIVVSKPDEPSQHRPWSNIQGVFGRIKKRLLADIQRGENTALGRLILGLDKDFDKDILSAIESGDTSLKEFQETQHRGTILSHVQGAGVQSLTEVVRALKKHKVDVELIARATEYRNRAFQTDAQIQIGNIKIKKSGKLTGDILIGVTLQDRYLNLIEGRQLQEIIEKELIPDLQNSIPGYAEARAGGTSIMDFTAEYIISLFKSGIDGKKITNNSKLNAIFKKGRTVNYNVPVSKVDFDVEINYARAKQALKRVKAEEVIDLNKKIPMMNRQLHDYIQQNMGKGGSKKILNYRTGRFARSAEIQTFVPSREKSAISAIVKYMKDPYQVFEPGRSKLATGPGRDPHVIFRRSIRQMLQDQKLGEFRRVKVELRG